MMMMGRRSLLFLLCLHSATEVDIFMLRAFVVGWVYIIIPLGCAPLVPGFSGVFRRCAKVDFH